MVLHINVQKFVLCSSSLCPLHISNQRKASHNMFNMPKTLDLPMFVLYQWGGADEDYLYVLKTIRLKFKIYTIFMASKNMKYT